MTMRTSIVGKVTLGLVIIVITAILAMCTTYYVSTLATKAVQASHDLTQAMLTAAAELEIDIVSGGLRTFQYLESGDPYYSQTYQQHSQRFRQYGDRLTALAHANTRNDIARAVDEHYKELDRISLAVMSNHDTIHQRLQAVHDQWRQLGMAAAKLEGATPHGSPQNALVKTIEAKLAELLVSLVEFLQRDRGNDSINMRLGELRALSQTHTNLTLPEPQKRLFTEFERALASFSESAGLALVASQEKHADMVKMLFFQRQIISTINARVKPVLEQQSNEAKTYATARLKQIGYIAGGLSLLLALVAILAGSYVRRAIAAPIRQLTAGADAVAAGDLNHRVAITTNDEYGDLARHFNHMVREVQSTTVSRTLLQEQQSQLRTLLDGVHDYAIFSIDDHGYVTRWNAASTRILGYEAGDMEGVSFSRIFKDIEVARRAQDQGLSAIQATGRFEIDTTLVRKNGEPFEANIVATPLVADDGSIKSYTVVVRDITERLKAERHIEALATKDTLTGLSNRSMLMEQLAAAIARASRAHSQLAVMFVDLDRFKAVNDMLGHAAGDELLRECAKRLLTCVRAGDVVARLGGDEFVVLLTDVSDAAIVAPIAERMLALLTMPYRAREQDAQISASIGICLYPTDGDNTETLLKNADIAMYHAKEQNRNNYQFYTEEMNQRVLRRAQLERELRAALENDEFILHHQPQVSVLSGEILGVESLIRWQHPTRGLLNPGDFIALAEETGLVVPIGEWVLNRACRTIKAWRAKGVNIPYIGVNVSAAQMDENLVVLVRQALVEHGIEAGWLMLEITETMLMENVDQAIAILQRIRNLGVRIGMDDFGTGYSSLGVLQRLPLDTIKIDRSFVSVIDDDANSTRAVAIIGAIIAIARELDLKVVAEGVETPTQLAFLRTLNCDAYQGYLFSKPVDTISMEARFTAPPASVLEDAQGRPITMTAKLSLDLIAQSS